MNYRIIEKDNEIFFKYLPNKKIKKNYVKKSIKETLLEY